MKFNRIFPLETWDIDHNKKIKNPVHNYIFVSRIEYSLDLAFHKKMYYVTYIDDGIYNSWTYNFKSNSLYKNRKVMKNLYYFSFLKRFGLISNKLYIIRYFLKESEYLNLEVKKPTNNDEIFDDKLNVMVNDFIKQN